MPDSPEHLLSTLMTVKAIDGDVAVCEISGANWGDIRLPAEALPVQVLEIVRSGKHAVVAARANVGVGRRELFRVEGPFELISAAGDSYRPAGRKRRQL